MLWAASMILGSTSRRLPSTNLAINGKAAATRGTMVAAVPTAVPMMSRDRGNTIIIRIRNGMDRRRLMSTFSACITPLGRGSTPPFSPTTSSTPKGRPMIVARSVESSVT